MSDKSDQKPKLLMTFVFDEVTVLTLKAEPNPQAKIQPPLNENAPPANGRGGRDGRIRREGDPSEGSRDPDREVLIGYRDE